MRITDLKPDPENARIHSDRNVEMITDSIRDVGAARSGVIDEHGTILAGNATWTALQAAGVDRVKVVEADGDEWVVVQRSGLSDEQKRRLALVDNRAAELASWNPEVLQALAESEPQTVVGLFTKDEMAAILPLPPVVPDAPLQPEPALPAECMVEIYCSSTDLEDFRGILTEWGDRSGVTVNISAG